MCICFRLSIGLRSPPIAIILSTEGCVLSSESFALPSRWAIQILSFLSEITRCMYSDSLLLAMSICLGCRLLSTMKDLFTLTKSLTQGSDSRLSPMAISHVVVKPLSMSILSRRAESSTMSLWLLTKVYLLPLSMAEASMSHPWLAFANSCSRKG